MLTSYLITAVSGAVICLIAAFCLEDMDTTAMDLTGYPLFTQLVDYWGTKASAAFFLISACVAGIGGRAQTLSYACQIAAFARDGGVPLASALARVNKRANMAVTAILALGATSCLVPLFSLSTVAKNIIYSLSTIAYLPTMGLPIVLRLFAGDKFIPGPVNWGRWSKPIFAWAIATQGYLLIMESFPPMRAWTTATFNYSWVIALAVIILSLALYPIIRKSYTVPNFEALNSYHEEIHGIAPGQTNDTVGAEHNPHSINAMPPKMTKDVSQRASSKIASIYIVEGGARKLFLYTYIQSERRSNGQESGGIRPIQYTLLPDIRSPSND